MLRNRETGRADDQPHQVSSCTVNTRFALLFRSILFQMMLHHRLRARRQGDALCLSMCNRQSGHERDVHESADVVQKPARNLRENEPVHESAKHSKELWQL